MRHRFAADQTAGIEQPRILSVELLERVVRQHDRPGLVGHAEDEGIATTDGTGRRGHQLVVGDGVVELGSLGSVDPVTEGRIDDNGHEGVRVLSDIGQHRVVELRQTGSRPPFGGDVRSVDHDMGGSGCLLHSGSRFFGRSVAIGVPRSRIGSGRLRTSPGAYRVGGLDTDGRSRRVRSRRTEPMGGLMVDGS